MVRQVLILLCASLLISSASGLILSEVLPNPDGPDEWIELIAEEDIDITQLTIKDGQSTDTIECCMQGCDTSVGHGTYFLILAKNNSFQGDGRVFCVDDRSIGNGLGNTGDSITVLLDGTIADTYTFSETSKGMSFALVGGEWILSIPSPLSPNPGSGESAETDSEIESGDAQQPDFELEWLDPDAVLYKPSKFFKIQNNRPEGAAITFELKVSMSGKVVHSDETSLSFKTYTTDTGTFEFTDAGIYEICGKIIENPEIALCKELEIADIIPEDCDVALDLKLDKDIYDAGEKISFTHILSDVPEQYTLDYWIETLDGKILKDKTSTENLNAKSYTPKKDGLEKALVLRSELKTQCRNSNPAVSATRLVGVRGDSGDATALTNSIQFVKVSPEPVKFGDLVEARLKVTKGTTKKTAITLKLIGESKLAKESSFNIYGENQEYELSVPMQISGDCRSKPGKYELVAEGIDARAEVEIQVSDEGCKALKEVSSNSEETICKEMPIETGPEFEVVDHISSSDNCFQAVKIRNDDDILHRYDVWSYVYKGSKAFCDREANKVTVEVEPHSTGYVTLLNELSETPEEASIKVKIKRDDRVTEEELTEKYMPSVKVVNAQVRMNAAAVENSLVDDATEKQDANPIAAVPTGKVVYESASVKAKNLSKYFVILLIIIGVYLFVRRIKS